MELLAFNSHDRPLRTDRQTDRDRVTHIERTHYLRHSLRSLGEDNEIALIIAFWHTDSNDIERNRSFVYTYY